MTLTIPSHYTPAVWAVLVAVGVLLFLTALRDWPANPFECLKSPWASVVNAGLVAAAWGYLSNWVREHRDALGDPGQLPSGPYVPVAILVSLYSVGAVLIAAAHTFDKFDQIIETHKNH